MLSQRLPGRIVVAAVMACVCSPGGMSSQPAAAASAFGVRNAHAIAYDIERRRAVLFGGADEKAVLHDTRTWDPAQRTWRFVTDGGPGPRTFPAMTYDHARRQVVLFGGNRVLFGSPASPPEFLADTWVLEGDVWRSRPGSGPPARAEAAIAYDRRRQVVVLFGGYMRDGERPTVRFGDTWEWDGSSWSQRASSGPSPRNGAAMAYDERLERAVLFGGSGASNETWAWDGRAWQRRTTQEVPGRFNPVMVFDSIGKSLVRFGGWSGRERTDDTWLFAGDWHRLKIDGPPARNHAAMAFDRHRGRAVLVGGHDGERVFGDTWEFDGRSWLRVADTPPLRRVENGH